MLIILAYLKEILSTKVLTTEKVGTLLLQNPVNYLTETTNNSVTIRVIVSHFIRVARKLSLSKKNAFIDYLSKNR